MPLEYTRTGTATQLRWSAIVYRTRQRNMEFNDRLCRQFCLPVPCIWRPVCSAESSPAGTDKRFLGSDSSGSKFHVGFGSHHQRRLHVTCSAASRGGPIICLFCNTANFRREHRNMKPPARGSLRTTDAMRDQSSLLPDCSSGGGQLQMDWVCPKFGSHHRQRLHVMCSTASLKR